MFERLRRSRRRSNTYSAVPAAPLLQSNFLNPVVAAKAGSVFASTKK